MYIIRCYLFIFEKTFDIDIDQNDIDDFIFQPQDIKYISDIKYFRIQDAVDYIEKKLRKLELIEK